MKLCWQKWKLTNTPVHADKEGETKEHWTGNTQKIIMREVMSQLKVEAVHFLQAHEGAHSVLCLWYKTKIGAVLHIIDDAQD